MKNKVSKNKQLFINYQTKNLIQKLQVFKKPHKQTYTAEP